MKPARTCPKCGTPLPADAPAGHCPQCLLALALAAQPGEATQAALEQATLDSGSSGAKTSAPALQFTSGDKVRYFGDYELLEEIARGGMGVVFKARQQSLNRIVAVKMILGGQLATEADVKRFRTEAEAAANLQHPNIVAIHEIGEHEGRHYFSMDFVEGKNLAQVIGGEPMAPVQAATLLKTLAEAVHYAHQRGTLHRDLKPHNVLIDPQGQPRITDFGLAKQMTAQSDLTHTGAVMGSPSYMPPEQATGRQAEVGPASDVYSLGAILYQMLTGKVPFGGATAVDTLRAVVEQEPVAPAKLNDRVPADLETICLKCLEKKPERRYASARALAEELARFLNHEPILARPASAGRKAWSWLVRHPWALTGIATMLLLGLTGLAYGLWEQTLALKWTIAHGRPASTAQAHSEFTVRTAWWLFALIFNGVAFVPLVFVDFVDRKRRNFAITETHVRAYAGIAGLEILVAFALALNLIRDHVWNGFRVEDLLAWWFKVVSPMWFSTLLLWHLIRQMRTSTFGVVDEQAETLYPRKPGHATVEQYRSATVLLLCLTAILVVGMALKSFHLATFGLLAAVAATLMLSGWRNQTAGRSFVQLSGVLLALGLAIQCVQAVRSVIYEPGSPFESRVTREWSATVAALTGALVAWLACLWNSRRTRRTPALTSRAVWPVHHLDVERVMLVGGLLVGGWAVLPFLGQLWRASQGAERRAYGMTLASATVFLAAFHLSWFGGLQAPLLKVLKQFAVVGLASFGIGCVALVAFHRLERNSGKKGLVVPP